MPLIGASPPDPYLLIGDNYRSTYGFVHSYRQTLGLARRSFTINPALKTLVHISLGQSWDTNVLPTLPVLSNAGAIDNLNIHDGGLYAIGGPLLGASYTPEQVPPLGPGNVNAGLADLLITNGKFDRVILATISVGGTTIDQWGNAGGMFSDRGPVIMRRLAARGITPSTPGVTFSCTIQDGITDFINGTSQASWAASCAGVISIMLAAGFVGRFFVPLQSYTGQTSNQIRSAQASMWDGVTVFSGGNDDDPSITLSDTVHPDDAGGVVLRNNRYNAMHASGTPF